MILLRQRLDEHTVPSLLLQLGGLCRAQLLRRAEPNPALFRSLNPFPLPLGPDLLLELGNRPPPRAIENLLSQKV